MIIKFRLLGDQITKDIYVVSSMSVSSKVNKGVNRIVNFNNYRNNNDNPSVNRYRRLIFDGFINGDIDSLYNLNC